MRSLLRTLFPVLAVVGIVLFAAAAMHCVFECHEDDGEDGCGCFCHAGASVLPAAGGVSFVLHPHSFVTLPSENVDSASPGGVFRPPIV